jgi:epoxide hydrolase-like predicted phosphatase
MSKFPQKTIVFDLGNVLLSFDFQIAANQLSVHAQSDPDEIVYLINQSELLHQFERGELSAKQFYDQVGQACGYKKDLKQFRLDFSNIFEEIQPMVDYFKQLKLNGYQVALFSNTNEMAKDFIQNKFSFFNNFDAVFLSYKHGLMKPTPALYKRVESALGKSGKDLFFIDDRPENIDTAFKLGWSGIIHTAPNKTINAANQWLTAS